MSGICGWLGPRVMHASGHALPDFMPRNVGSDRLPGRMMSNGTSCVKLRAQDVARYSAATGAAREDAESYPTL